MLSFDIASFGKIIYRFSDIRGTKIANIKVENEQIVQLVRHEII